MKKVIYLFLMVQLLLSCSDDDAVSNNNNACESAGQEVTEAAKNYSTDQNEASCNIYKKALEDQIAVCGDTTGSLQLLIDGLRDCTVSTSPGFVTVKVSGVDKVFEDNVSVNINGTTITIKAEDVQADDWVSFDIEQGEVGENVVSNFVINILSFDFFPSSFQSTPFVSSVSINESNKIEATFSGTVVADSGSALDLVSGVVSINY